MATTSQSIQEIYIGLLGRAADKAGLDYWTAEIDANTLTLEQLRANIVNDQAEYAADLGSKTRSQTVAELYNRMFERAAEAADLTYWVDGDGASVNIDQLVLALTNGAAASDRLVLDNKTEAAEFYSANTTAYTADGAKASVDSVDGTSASLDASKAATSGDSQSAGTTFTLTTSADSLTGTTSSDTFVAELNGSTATTNTLGAADTLIGGAGVDTLDLTLGGVAGGNYSAGIPAVDAQDIEVINVRAVSGAAVLVDGSSFAGSTEFSVDRSTDAVSFNNIGTADLTIKGNDTVTNGAVNFNGSTATSVTDALTINVKDGVEAGAVASNNANDDWTAVTINSTGGTETATANANVLTSMDLAGGDTMQSLTINATTSLTTGAIAGWDTTDATAANKGAITITGAGAVNVGALDAAVETVTASGNAGGVTLTASTQTDFTFTGSTGNDRVTTNAVLATTGGVDAGEGTGDRLTLTNSTHVTATVGDKYSNFEELEIGNGVTVDLDHLATNNTISSIRLIDGGVANDLSADQAANVTVTTGGNIPTIAVKGAATVGQIDTVHITADDGAAATATINLATPVLADIEKIKLTATDNITVAALTGANAFDSIVLDGAGTIGITSGAITPAANTVIDGSAATGALTLNFGGITGAADTNAMSIKGGSAGDTITAGGGAADLINGMGGIDAITVTKDGTNSGFATVQSDAIASTDGDLITGFVTTENDFDYNGTLANGTGAGAGIAATEVASEATFSAGLASGDAANDIVFIATTDLTGGNGNAELTTLATTYNAANADALETALVGTGGALNGAIANLDTILGTSDSALLVLDEGTNSVVLRVTNTDQSTANTLTADEIEVVGVFAATAALAAADFV